ncbi:MAG TPA: 5-formyltetrahydrofolate cyclo-ligase [Burkholderiaceae bacterium]|nr:5-formyltetrahydrofolate cyclo-ligase [Burkholderiaceae bacterium]
MFNTQNTDDVTENPSENDTDFQRDVLRARLLAAREVMADRAVHERELVARVGRWLRTMPVTRLAFFWPIRGEPDLTAMIGQWLNEDPQRRAGLPVVVGDLLEFAPWAPGVAMQPGAHGIPVPARNARMSPQLLLIPCVAIDSLRYRLGYGGGYYDRTLAALKPRPVTVGVAFDDARVNTIAPKPHDIRLDLAITQSGVL